MPIDIDQLTEPELIDLNHRIVARLRFLRQVDAHASMLEFCIGERVTFHPDGQPPVTGDDHALQHEDRQHRHHRLIHPLLRSGTPSRVLHFLLQPRFDQGLIRHIPGVAAGQRIKSLLADRGIVWRRNQSFSPMHGPIKASGLLAPAPVRLCAS